MDFFLFLGGGEVVWNFFLFLGEDSEVVWIFFPGGGTLKKIGEVVLVPGNDGNFPEAWSGVTGVWFW